MKRIGARLVAYLCAQVPRFDPHDPDRSTWGVERLDNWPKTYGSWIWKNPRTRKSGKYIQRPKMFLRPRISNADYGAFAVTVPLTRECSDTLIAERGAEVDGK